MCEICHQNPCHVRCPNSDEDGKCYKCDECGYDIYEGDVYYRIEEMIICEECIAEFKYIAQKF